MTLLLAGHETTATTLAWVLQYVLANPDAHARVRAEALAFGGGVPGSTDLPFLDAVIKETQRLMPILPLVGRRLRVPTTIGGRRSGERPPHAERLAEGRVERPVLVVGRRPDRP